MLKILGICLLWAAAFFALWFLILPIAAQGMNQH